MGLSMRILEIIIALAFAASFVSAYDVISRKFRSFEPISDWFNVLQISVADVGTGQDVLVLYDREIKQTFKGTYTVKVVEITDKGTGFPLCDNSEVVSYKPRLNHDPSVISLSDFVGEPCKLKDGRYRIEASWFIDRGEKYEPETVESVSNVFNVGKPFLK